MTKLLAILFLAASAGFAQLDDNTITITATRQITLQPDQIVFDVSVQTPQSAGLQDALAKVPGTGITAAELTEVYTDVQATIEWDFTVTAPVSQAGAMVTMLAQLGQQSQGTVSFIVEGAQVSRAAQQSQPCSQTALVADAQKQAQALASAAGFTVGPVLAVSDGSGVQGVPTAVRGESLAILGAFVSAIPPVVPATPVTCTAVVKFQLYSYH